MLFLSPTLGLRVSFPLGEIRVKLMKVAVLYSTHSICVEVYVGFRQARCSSRATRALSNICRLGKLCFHISTPDASSALGRVPSGLPHTLVQIVHCTVQSAPVSSLFITRTFLLEQLGVLRKSPPFGAQHLTTNRPGLSPLLWRASSIPAFKMKTSWKSFEVEMSAGDYISQGLLHF